EFGPVAAALTGRHKSPIGSPLDVLRVQRDETGLETSRLPVGKYDFREIEIKNARLPFRRGKGFTDHALDPRSVRKTGIVAPGSHNGRKVVARAAGLTAQLRLELYRNDRAGRDD